MGILVMKNSQWYEFCDETQWLPPIGGYIFHFVETEKHLISHCCCLFLYDSQEFNEPADFKTPRFEIFFSILTQLLATVREHVAKLSS